MRKVRAVHAPVELLVRIIGPALGGLHAATGKNPRPDICHACYLSWPHSSNQPSPGTVGPALPCSL